MPQLRGNEPILGLNKMMINKRMRLQYVIMMGLTRTPKPIVKIDSMDAKMRQRIYLGNPCSGRIYHLIMTLLKKLSKLRVTLQWGRS
jgi:hypothetical protein